MSRRLNFLNYILREDKDSLIYKVLQAQLRKPTSNDWGTTVHKDLQQLGIETPLSEVGKYSETSWKNIVREKVKAETLRYLNGVKSKHSKVRTITHKNLGIQDYLSPNEVTIIEAKFLFQLRIRMVQEIKTNFGGNYSEYQCPLCHTEVDTQEHLLDCPDLDETNDIVKSVPKYKELFDDEVKKKVKVSKIIKKRYQKRKQLMKKKAKGPSDPSN